MKITTTPISGLLIIEPKVFKDDRGYFFEAYNEAKYFDAGLKAKFVQDNISYSYKNSIRGLHYQLEPYAQGKLVEVLQGRVLDVAVDLRENSPTFGQYYSIELSDANQLQFFVPKGFAHGFSVLSESAIFHYKCDNIYHQASERGIKFDDSFLNIDWQVDLGKSLVSPKDKILPSFKNAEKNFSFEDV